MEQVISISEAQNSFTRILKDAGKSGRGTVIQRNNQPVAVLISYRQYQKFLALQQQAAARRKHFAVYDEIRARNQNAAPEKVMADVTQSIADIRKQQ